MDKHSTNVLRSKEIAVDTHRIFLLHRGNRNFLAGRTDIPIVGTPTSPTAVIGIMTILGGGGGWVAYSLREYVPLLSAIPLQLSILLFMLLGVVAGGVLLWHDRHGAHRLRRSSGTDIVPLEWLVLEGEVIQAEKLRQWHWYSIAEKVAVQYRFTVPNGEIYNGRSEGLLKDSNHTMAPVPGTSIYVLYNLNGWFHLL